MRKTHPKLTGLFASYLWWLTELDLMNWRGSYFSKTIYRRLLRMSILTFYSLHFILPEILSCSAKSLVLFSNFYRMESSCLARFPRRLEIPFTPFCVMSKERYLVTSCRLLLNSADDSSVLAISSCILLKFFLAFSNRFSAVFCSFSLLIVLISDSHVLKWPSVFVCVSF